MPVIKLSKSLQEAFNKAHGSCPHCYKSGLLKDKFEFIDLHKHNKVSSNGCENWKGLKESAQIHVSCCSCKKTFMTYIGITTPGVLDEAENKNMFDDVVRLKKVNCPACGKKVKKGSRRSHDTTRAICKKCGSSFCVIEDSLLKNKVYYPRKEDFEDERLREDCVDLLDAFHIHFKKIRNRLMRKGTVSDRWDKLHEKYLEELYGKKDKFPDWQKLIDDTKGKDHV